jgi:hypothetical protein
MNKIVIHENASADWFMQNGSYGKVQLGGDLNALLQDFQSRGIDVARALDNPSFFVEYQPIIIRCVGALILVAIIAIF